MQEAAQKWLSCKMWHKNGYLARTGTNVVILQELAQKYKNGYLAITGIKMVNLQELAQKYKMVILQELAQKLLT